MQLMIIVNVNSTHRQYAIVENVQTSRTTAVKESDTAPGINYTASSKVEIKYRATKAEKLIHKEFKVGHTHIMEAFHNILIRYRSKHIAPERLHYHVSTDLGLLQANLLVMRERKGINYHWISELYQRLGLPLYDGVRKSLFLYGQHRDRILNKSKEKESKRKRISWKVQRKLDSQWRKEWSHQHGNDTYGKLSNNSSKKCRCGSSEHSRITHRDCPLNKKSRYSSLFGQPYTIISETCPFLADVISWKRMLFIHQQKGKRI